MRATRLSLMVLLVVLAFVLWNAAWVTDRCGEWTAALDEAEAALAQGGSTVKLKYGHRGVNQPARDVCGTRTFLTSQNHGYAVVPESVKTGVIRYVNANDGTCEGVDYPDLQAFSVQFHPEACSGPHDTAFLFDRFCDLMGGAHHAD